MNFGLYDCILLSRIMITLAFARMKRIIFSVDAVFMSVSRSSATIATTMNAPVRIMLMCGVLNRKFTRASIGGSRLSLLIAIGEREAANIPPFAVVMNAAIAAMLRIAKPVFPMNFAAADEIGA